MKKLINSFLFKPYRRAYLREILKQIESGREKYCCHVKYSDLICWKDLKEVLENHESTYILKEIKDTNSFDCLHEWFHNQKARIAFLKECLANLDK